MPDRGLTTDVAHALHATIQTARDSVAALQRELATLDTDERTRLLDSAVTEVGAVCEALADLVRGAPFDADVWELLSTRMPPGTA